MCSPLSLVDEDLEQISSEHREKHIYLYCYKNETSCCTGMRKDIRFFSLYSPGGPVYDITILHTSVEQWNGLQPRSACVLQRFEWGVVSFVFDISLSLFRLQTYI